eukprot:COSAG02_NODE_68053_length_251_cov_1.006579_1_plen_23_part_10
MYSMTGAEVMYNTDTVYGIATCS